MIPVRLLASWARLRATNRVNEESKKRGDIARMFTAQRQLFHERLIDACKRVADEPAGFPEVGFICLPERFLGKMAYLCVGSARAKKKSPEPPEGIRQETIDLLRDYDSEQKSTRFRNLESPSVIEHAKSILVCHGLSPIGDSILLLAELGRCLRLSWAFGIPLRIMLADISWMSSNRSIRQFSSLDEGMIDTGLRVCLDKRRRLYDAIQATCNTREIAPFDRAGAISKGKLELISRRYNDLAKTLWGKSGKLDHQDVRMVCRPLDQLLFQDSSEVPDAISVIGQFPRTLAGLEAELRPHLEIIRTVAKQFNSFDAEVFTYFFAQYYAQQPYRGKTIKIAPISETKFDEPFDELDGYFQAWGEGHSTSQIITGTTAVENSDPLAAVYLPQYRVGGLQLLPYTPLSLDALKGHRDDHNEIAKQMIAIYERTSDIDETLRILMNTPVYHRNRLVGDVLGFLQHCVRLWGETGLRNQCQSVGFDTWADFMATAPPVLRVSAEMEADLVDSDAVKELWRTWFRAAEFDEYQSLVPSHLFFALSDELDWDEQLSSFSANVIGVARAVVASVV